MGLPSLPSGEDGISWGSTCQAGSLELPGESALVIGIRGLTGPTWLQILPVVRGVTRFPKEQQDSPGSQPNVKRKEPKARRDGKLKADA